MDQRLRSPTRVLLTSRRRGLADAVGRALNLGHCITRVLPAAEDAASAMAEWRPHLVIVDLELEGNDWPRWFQGCRIPLIALTERSELEARLRAFAQGVDDVVTVPFFPEELAARVAAVLRRTYRDAAVFLPSLRRGDLEIDIRNRRVRAGGAELRLTSIEQSLLYLLAASGGRVLTRDEILDDLWGAEYVAESNIVDRHIHNLRVKLQHGSGQARYIVTVPGRGYRFLIPADEGTS